MALIQLIYSSALAPGVDPSCVKDIVREAVTNNARQQVTGMLLFVNGSFLQVLEGERDTVGALYRKISEDPRHERATVLGEVIVPQRQFAEWSMGLGEVSAKELDQLACRNDFFTRGHCLYELEPGMARTILREFRFGAWRAKVQ